MIRTAHRDDVPALLAVLSESGQFGAGALAHVCSELVRFTEGCADSLWLTADDGEPIGFAFTRAEPVASGTWNLLLLWVRPDRQHRGHGAALVAQTTLALRARSARLLIVETSGLPAFASARAFYCRQGCLPEARVRDFFAPGDDKLIYARQLA